jgi:hypothetical protein
MTEETQPNGGEPKDESKKGAAAKKAVAKKGDTLWGVLKTPTGSHTLGEHTFVAMVPTLTPASVKELACSETTPVEFFDDEEAAAKAVKKLKDRFDRKPLVG